MSRRGFTLLEAMLAVTITVIIVLGVSMGFSQMKSFFRMNAQLTTQTEMKNMLFSLTQEMRGANGSVFVPDGDHLSFEIFVSSVNYTLFASSSSSMSAQFLATVTYRYDPEKREIIRDYALAGQPLESKVVLRDVRRAKDPKTSQDLDVFQGTHFNSDYLYRQVSVNFKLEAFEKAGKDYSVDIMVRSPKTL